MSNAMGRDLLPWGASKSSGDDGLERRRTVSTKAIALARMPCNTDGRAVQGWCRMSLLNKTACKMGLHKYGEWAYRYGRCEQVRSCVRCKRRQILTRHVYSPSCYVRDGSCE